MKLQSIDMKRTKDIAKIATPHSVAHMVSPATGQRLARSCATRSHGSITANGTRLTGGQNRSIFCTSQTLVE